MSTRKKIMICDDEVHVEAALRSKLTSAGFDVVGCADGEEAWEHIENELPNLLITDYHMPRLNGLQLIERIRECEQTQHLDVFILTGRSLDQSFREMADRLGILGLIPKPFSPRDVLRRVERAIELQTLQVR
jgi:DNA-binding response OmpR family regulator